MIRPLNQKHHLRISLVMFIGMMSGSLTILSIILFNPSTIGPIGVTLWFVNLMVFLAAFFGLIFYFARKSKDSGQMLTQKFSSSLRIGFLVSFAITFMLALRSLRNLTFKDVILLMLILTLIEIYFRTKSNAR